MPLLILIVITLLCTGLTNVLLAPLLWMASIHLPFWLLLAIGIVFLSWFIGD